MMECGKYRVGKKTLENKKKQLPVVSHTKGWHTPYQHFVMGNLCSDLTAMIVAHDKTPCSLQLCCWQPHIIEPMILEGKLHVTSVVSWWSNVMDNMSVGN